MEAEHIARKADAKAAREERKTILSFLSYLYNLAYLKEPSVIQGETEKGGLTQCLALQTQKGNPPMSPNALFLAKYYTKTSKEYPFYSN